MAKKSNPRVTKRKLKDGSSVVTGCWKINYNHLPDQTVKFSFGEGFTLSDRIWLAKEDMKDRLKYAADSFPYYAYWLIAGFASLILVILW